MTAPISHKLIKLMGTVVITVWGGKGGLGKTTTAERLALILGLLGYKVLLVDANIDQRSAQAVWKKYKQTGFEPPYDFALEEDFALIGRARKLGYDFVIVDCPPSKREASGALEQADFVLVPYTPKWMETQAITLALDETIRPLGKLHKVLFVGVANSEQRAAAEARKGFSGFSVPMYDTTVRLYKGHQNSQARGFPLFLPEASAYQRGEPVVMRDDRSKKPFIYESDDYTLQAWHDSCLFHFHDADLPDSREECRIPVCEPDGTLSQSALDLIAAQVGGSFDKAADDYRDFFREFLVDIKQNFGEAA